MARLPARPLARFSARFAWLVLLLPMLAACGSSGDGADIAWREVPTPSPIPTEEPSAPTAEAATVPVPTPTPVTLTDDQIAHYRPNELGRIPILMFHGFTHDAQYTDNWTVTFDQFRDILQWLYERNFYMVSMADMINNEISAPPGKHPVVLTFDDASSRQFRLMKSDDGTLTPAPDSAVGVMEAFFAEHPDFGRGGFFAVLPINCFRYDGEETTCEERLTWLDDHGYEIGNHTWDHLNLADVSDATLIDEVGSTKVWIDERVKGDGNLGNVLVLPYGNFPGYDWQIQMLKDGFTYDGQQIILAGIVSVEGGASASPSSGKWTRWNIARFNMEPELWAYWQGIIDTGAVTFYTSDGNPGTVTIPDPIPADLEEHWDPEWASSYGMEVIRYDASALPPLNDAANDGELPPSPAVEGTPPSVDIPAGSTPPHSDATIPTPTEAPSRQTSRRTWSSLRPVQGH